MKTYNTLTELVTATRCPFAQWTRFGWVARRTAKNATHGLAFTWVNGHLDRDAVMALELPAAHQASAKPESEYWRAVRTGVRPAIWPPIMMTREELNHFRATHGIAAA